MAMEFTKNEMSWAKHATHVSRCENEQTDSYSIAHGIKGTNHAIITFNIQACFNNNTIKRMAAHCYD